MKENLKPTSENINKAKFKSTPNVISFDPFGETPMSKVVNEYNEYKVKVAEKLDNDIFGVCIQLLEEEGSTHEYVLNKEFIVDAVRKVTAKKPLFIVGDYDLPICPECKQMVEDYDNYCSECGQKLDWSDTK